MPNLSKTVSQTNRTDKIRASISAVFLLAAGLFFIYPGDLTETAFSQARRSRAAVPQGTSRYRQFPHDVKAHRMECNNCHKFPSPNWNKVRTGDAAFPDITEYPKHESCIGCHRQQFFKGAQPSVCSICHVNPSPRDSRRFPFPNPRELFDQGSKGKIVRADFSVFFPHDKHIDIVTGGLAPSPVFRNVSFSPRQQTEESCSVCHKTLQPQGDSDVEYATKPPANLGEDYWLKKGTFKSVPIGHTTCFTCHSQDSGIEPAPTNCAACHKLKTAQPPADFDAKLAARMGVTDRVTLDLWRSRHSAGKFRHEWTSHADLSCSTCHNVTAMVTTDPATRKVPVAACGTCHATATSDDGGAINFEVDAKKKSTAFECSKCHVTFGKKPIPDSHLKAIADAGGRP